MLSSHTIGELQLTIDVMTVLPASMKASPNRMRAIFTQSSARSGAVTMPM